MKRSLLPLLLLLLLCSSGQASPLKLDLEVTKQVSVDEKASPPEKKRVTVVLAPDYLEIVEDGGRLVHDFKAKRSYRFEGKETVNRSLYADVGFRVAEMRNRLGLQKAMEEAKVETGLLGDTALVEHLFSIDDEVSEAGLVKSESKVVTFRHRDHLLAEFSSRGKKLEPEQAQAFVRFLRYYCGGHPDILSELTVRALLPEETRLDFYTLNEVDSYRLRLLGSHAHTVARPDLSAVPLSPPGEPLLALGEAALKLSPDFVAKAADNAALASATALEKGDPLGAALRLFEAMLMDGRDITEPLTRMRPAVEADATSGALIKALILGETDAVAGEKALAQLEPKAGAGQHVVAIFRAGLMLGSKRPTEARDLYVKALAANPAIAGAWKDLGDIYHSNYETDFAWACWDVGRALAPKHPMLREVNKLEEYLRTNYPGFF